MRNRLETGRLLLRPLQFSDAEAIHHHCRDGEIARFTARVPHPYPLLAVELYVLSAIARAGKHPGCIYAIEEKATGRMIGSAAAFKRSPSEADLEVGYWIGADHAGQGFATEAAGAVIAEIRAEDPVARIVAGHFSDNPASRRILEKTGFRYTGEETRLFSMGRMEYASSLDMVCEPG